MNRRGLGSIIWIAYLIFFVLWIFVLPKYIPQIAGYGYIVPFFFFFPFFRRRGGHGQRPRPTTTSTDKRNDRPEDEYTYESMLSDANSGSPYSHRNVFLYVIGAAIIVIAIAFFFFNIL